MIKEVALRFDAAVIGVTQHWPGWLHTPMLLITNAGQPIAMALLAAIVATLAMQQGQMRIIYSMALSVVAMGATTLLKYLVGRSRPESLYADNMFFQTGSFPSAHTVATTVVCGLLTCLAIKYLPSPWNYVFAGLLVAFIVLVGVSRVYLGAHFPTDVVAGWLLGIIAVTLIVVFVRP